MRRINTMLLGILVCALALIVHAAPTTKPSSPSTRPAASMRLFAPYSKMNSLSDDQKEKIHEIHHKYLDDMHDLERKQTDDIAALLSEDQKKELREVEDKTSADAKAKSGAKKDPSMTDGEK